MNIVVFLGPSLPPAEAQEKLPAIYCPPAARGDVYRATLLRPAPAAIAIIDGLFTQQAAVNHKEILWAMTQGIHVFGASSMGALRAAELADFGMVGIGQIYEQLRSGELEDDDEVAITHGPQETGYVPLSDAMVDMRAMFKAALAGGVISAATEDMLLQASKDCFYPERSYARSLALAVQRGANKGELDEFRSWLPLNNRSQKRDDALRLLSFIEQFLASSPGPKTVSYTFERTEFWQRGLQEFAAVKPGVDWNLGK